MAIISSDAIKRAIHKEKKITVRNKKGIELFGAEEWKRLVYDFRHYGYSFIAKAIWSGYSGNQRREVSRFRVPFMTYRKNVLESVEFTDGTTMDVRVLLTTPEKLLEEGENRKVAYQGLLEKLFVLSSKTYKVTGDSMSVILD